jgi:hypothetical protein
MPFEIIRDDITKMDVDALSNLASGLAWLKTPKYELETL